MSWPEWQAAYDRSSLVADPLLVDALGGDAHLQPESPCIDRGDNAFASDADVYGGPRIIGDIVDIGAAEFAPLLGP